MKLVGLLQKSLRKKKRAIKTATHRLAPSVTRSEAERREKQRSERHQRDTDIPYETKEKRKKGKEEEPLVDVPRDVSSEILPVSDSALDRSFSLILKKGTDELRRWRWASRLKKKERNRQKKHIA